MPFRSLTRASAPADLVAPLTTNHQHQHQQGFEQAEEERSPLIKTTSQQTSSSKLNSTTTTSTTNLTKSKDTNSEGTTLFEENNQFGSSFLLHITTPKRIFTHPTQKEEFNMVKDKEYEKWRKLKAGLHSPLRFGGLFL